MNGSINRDKTRSRTACLAKKKYRYLGIRYPQNRLFEFWKLLLVISTIFHANEGSAQGTNGQNAGVWRPLPSSQEGGLFTERLMLWRNFRMLHMLTAEDDYLLSGFESRPGRHPWQGEHVGKWLHAATLAYEQTHDEKLLKALQETANRLLAAQDANGYLGTYGADYTFMAKPEMEKPTEVANEIATPKEAVARDPKGGWDTWTFRYNIYGLLTYEKFHPDERVVEACRKMADLLIEVYGEGKADITKYGSRHGMSTATLLESILMLHKRTGDKKYLEFAKHIVAQSEKSPKFRLMGNMLENGCVVYPGDGKAYQLMSNLLGYAHLYETTGDQQYLKTAQHAWEDIKQHHLDVTGGPWSLKMPYNGNRECFALPQDYDPAAAEIETCCTTTWIQLNLILLEMTGQAKYAAESERALYNSLMAAQFEEGINWCYYTRANQLQRPYEAAIKCCSSSGPRSLEMFAQYQIGKVNDAVSFTSLSPCSIELPEDFGRAKIEVTGNHPISPKAKIVFEHAVGKKFPVEFRPPLGAQLLSLRFNGQETELNKNIRGYHEISRAWKTGDEVAIDFEYLIETHLQTGKEGKKWIAFSYGPWTLAQTTAKDTPLAEPFLGKNLDPEKIGQQSLEVQSPRPKGAPTFRIKDTDIVLAPFYSAGSRDSGPRTYFQLSMGEKLPPTP